jgi:hypothetical protein
MPRILKQAALYTSFAIALLFPALSKAQQQPPTPPHAPVPAQIIAGKKAFISNASGESVTPTGTGGLTYDQFFASMKTWGRYDLISAPADADLVFEIRYETPLGPVSFGNSSSFPLIRLTILDPKTHTILWAFTELVRQVSSKSTGLQNFQQAMSNLIDEIKALAAAPASSVISNAPPEHAS